MPESVKSDASFRPSAETYTKHYSGQCPGQQAGQCTGQCAESHTEQYAGQHAGDRPSGPYRRQLILPAQGEPAALHAALSPHALSLHNPSLHNLSPHTIWLTDELLFSFQRCHRRAYLDRYGDLEYCDAPSDYLLKLRQDSLAHRREILQDAVIHEADYPRSNWAAGAETTLTLMQQGVERISRGVLLTEYRDGVMLVSCPDLLVRHPGESVFGDWMYVPTDIRLGKRPKLDYQVMAAFHAYVLAAVQGAWCDTSWLMLRQRGPYAVDLVDLVPRMEEILYACAEMLIAQREPEVFIAHNRCDLCHWYSFCYGLATGDRHLSLLPGVTPSRYVYLKQMQITTLEALAATPVRELEMLPGFGPAVAHKLVHQAQATLNQEALLNPSLSHGALLELVTHRRLPTAEVELYFDIESAPEQNVVYLHGVLVVDRGQGHNTFYALLAETPEDERLAWNQLMELFQRYPDAPIFHFCPYEVQTVRRLGELFGPASEVVEDLLTRFVDLHDWVTQVALLPVESYALKAIARWLGFNWRDAEANGAQSIFWYAQWLQTGDRAFLESILRYNEDDCRATHCVKDWLVAFITEKVQEIQADQGH
ncbi:TM0106 family RecB-like putative nuclease [Thermoleptolyngbya sichuanensis]|uniref:TM0106 family RecB-like putative nuclease n=1 Tax=Thermoleptolyngbya sichuanensis TaxID=2885951 RepID=UPI001CEC764C|nr:TM0106 family RecB-like putative nuclease [Thermoleptolyngbya sichuanensis]